MIEMSIEAVRVSMQNLSRVLILKEKESDRYLVIWIGPSEAEAIAMRLGEAQPPRPMTHDLLRNIITDLDGADEPEPAEETGGSLASVAKAAALKAERAAIEQTLQQVQWNRRKAALILGVSYKTLLNKIKECGISRA